MVDANYVENNREYVLRLQRKVDEVAQKMQEEATTRMMNSGLEATQKALAESYAQIKTLEDANATLAARVKQLAHANQANFEMAHAQRNAEGFNPGINKLSSALLEADEEIQTLRANLKKTNFAFSELQQNNTKLREQKANLKRKNRKLKKTLIKEVSRNRK